MTLPSQPDHFRNVENPWPLRIVIFLVILGGTLLGRWMWNGYIDSRIEAWHSEHPDGR